MSTDAAQLFGPDHVKAYRETDGRVGHDWKRGAPTLILTTTGRRSGERRDNPLIYGRHGDDYLIVASKGGWDRPPVWYLNLQHDPRAEIQVWGERLRVRARDATPEEKPVMWRAMAEIWPDYDDYQRATDREIPVVVLEPESE